ncbi:MAG: ABC transporter ATP-binding protein [Bacteroidetes bacterium]|nr:ABC transporter ATP-binding protein [Bacteroidota bacterium]
MRALTHLNKYFYKYRYRLFLGMLWVTLSNLFAIFPAQSVRIVIDLIKENIATYKLFDGSKLNSALYHFLGITILYFSVIIIGLALLRGFFMYMMRQSLIVMSRLVEYDLKNEIFNHYQTLGMNFFRQINTGDLMARISEDVGRVRMYIGPAVMYSVNLAVTFIIVLWAMFSVSAKLSFWVLIPLPFLSYSIFYVNTIINKRSDVIQSKLSDLTTFVQEAFSGIRVLKAFAREKASQKDFYTETEEYKKKQLHLAKVEALFFPLMFFLTGFSSIITILVGGLMVINGEITIGNIAEFIIYINMLTWPVASLGWVSSLIQRADASQKRINEFLFTKPEIISTSIETFNFNHKIEFRNVSYTYPEKILASIKNISFTINKGTHFGILGSTGSGKTTLLNLILRLIDATEGEILIDDNNLKNINLKAYKKQIGYVPQDVFLFSDTISNNIILGVESLPLNAKTIVEQAAQNASLSENIESFANKYETVLGERGVTLSGGQKQRVAIARAFVKNPDILIFDDCLSALDTKTEATILNNIKSIGANKTVITVSHRASSLKNCDYIIVLNEGAVIEEGTPETLLLKKGVYFDVIEKQISSEITIS